MRGTYRAYLKTNIILKGFTGDGTRFVDMPNVERVLGG